MNLNPSRLIAVAALTALASIASAVPLITEVVASPGSTAGGTTVVIRGSALAAVNLVTIGGSSAPITSINANTIFCTSPAGQGRNLAVQVFEAGNPSNIVNTFSYDLPRIANFSSNTSPTSGGSVLTITGSNFGTNRTVTIGGNTALPTGTNTHTQIQVVVPPGQGLNVPVVVTCSGQTNIAAETPGFSYTPPILSLLSPINVSTSGGTASITGTNLGLSPQVIVNGVPTTIVPGNTHTSLTFNVPVGKGTGIPVQVNVGGQISNTLLLSYPPPNINFVLPNSGSTAGGNVVSLSGINFGAADTAQIFFDSNPVETLSSSTGHTTVQFVAPPSQGPIHTIRVAVAGQSSNIVNYFIPGPVITSIEPVNFSIAGGDIVVLRGTNFGTSGSVTFGSTPAQTLSHNHDSIVCRVPPGTAPGNVLIRADISGVVSNTPVGNYVCPADFNNDGSVDFFDYLDFVAAFSTPC